MSDSDRPILAIVPARGGSRGIPRKVLQPVAGIPLILRTLQTVSDSRVADRIVVSTEDAEIAVFCRLRGYEVIDRPAELATDDAVIADVTKDVINALGWDGLVLVAQPTCPLITDETIVSFVQEFLRMRLDWAISGSEDAHLFWQGDICIQPRKNRQQLVGQPWAVWRESGAIQMMTSAHAREGGGICKMLPIPASEALDIDTHADLEQARLVLGGKTIVFWVAVGKAVGSGHFWRCLQLSDALSHHNIRWVFTHEKPGWATDILDRHGIDYCRWGSWNDLVVFDCLDAAADLLGDSAGTKSVVFEYDGPASKYADLVVDEFTDPRWTILRPEFMCLPERTIKEKGSRILVTFGGTDPAGLNHRLGSMLAYAMDADVRIAAGPGCDIIMAGLATVLPAAHMAEQMLWADLVVTGQGRTVAEAVACGTPVVSIAVNERESRHAKLPGVLYLGLWAAISDEALMRTVSRLLDRPDLRREMSQTARASIDDRGLRRVVRAIEGLLEEV